MSINSPLFDKIRSKPSRAQERVDTAPRCEAPGCTRLGDYRAPKGRDHEGQFFRFCVEHVKEYNQTYNYFQGMSDSAVQAYHKDALTGHRPTWTAGVNGTIPVDSAIDPASLLRQRMERLRKARAESASAKPRYGKLALKALETLGLETSAEKPDIRRRFKEMAKRLHPDLNEGDRSREDKLRAVVEAYNYLKSVGLA